MNESTEKTCAVSDGALGAEEASCEKDGKSCHQACLEKEGGNEATAPAEAPAPVAKESPLKTLLKKISPVKLAVIGVAVLAVIILLVVLLSPPPVDDVVMAEETVEIVEGESLQLEYKVYPSKAKVKNETWESSDEDVAEVNEYGRVEAKAAGECEITFTVGDIETEVQVIVKKDLPDFNKLFDEYCSSNWAEVGSDGSYLEVDTNPYDRDDYNDSQADSAIEKINNALGLSDSVYKDMCSTTWSMGKQSESFEDIGLKVEWTYHSDKGLEVTYKYIHN